MKLKNLEIACHKCRVGMVRVDSNPDFDAPLVLVDGECDTCHKVARVFVHATGADGESEIPG